jgi:hypothetical protein
MDHLPDTGGTIGIIAGLVVLVVITFVVRRLLRARAMRPAAQAPSAPPQALDAAFLDSSHIIDTSPLAGGAELQVRPPAAGFAARDARAGGSAPGGTTSGRVSGS